MVRSSWMSKPISPKAQVNSIKGGAHSPSGYTIINFYFYVYYFYFYYSFPIFLYSNLALSGTDSIFVQVEGPGEEHRNRPRRKQAQVQLKPNWLRHETSTLVPFVGKRLCRNQANNAANLFSQQDKLGWRRAIPLVWLEMDLAMDILSIMQSPRIIGQRRMIGIMSVANINPSS